MNSNSLRRRGAAIERHGHGWGMSGARTYLRCLRTPPECGKSAAGGAA